jgi:hypothetical protein
MRQLGQGLGEGDFCRRPAEHLVRQVANAFGEDCLATFLLPADPVAADRCRDWRADAGGEQQAFQSAQSAAAAAAR